MGTHLHRVQLTQRRLSHRHLYRRDAETPDIGLGVVTALLDDFGRHPVGRSYKGVLLGHGRGELTRDSEIGELDCYACEQGLAKSGRGRRGENEPSPLALRRTLAAVARSRDQLRITAKLQANANSPLISLCSFPSP